MSLEADYIVDRRRMRRKLTFWRVLAVLIAVAAVVAVAALARGGSELGLGAPVTPQIARVTIRGLIRGDLDRAEAIDALAKARAARAVIVHIDSPGGTTAGAEQLHNALRRLATQKPTVAVVDGLAASGGYIAALASDHIVAQQTSLIGSIGVIFQYPNVADLLRTIGVKIEEIKSAPLKAAPNGYEPTSPEARAAVEAVVMDTHAWFRALVRDRRALDPAALDQVADGRVFTGRQAMALKLVDEIGGERAAIEWLAREKGVDANLPVRDWKLRNIGELSFLHLALVTALEAVGLRSLAERIEETGAWRTLERLNLDGLLALWHPPAN